MLLFPLIVLLCLSNCMHVYVTVNLVGRVRGQPDGVTSLLVPCGAQSTQTLRLGSTHRSFLPDSPTPLIFEACNGIEFVVLRYFSQPQKVSCRLSSDFHTERVKEALGNNMGQWLPTLLNVMTRIVNDTARL